MEELLGDGGMFYFEKTANQPQTYIIIHSDEFFMGCSSMYRPENPTLECFGKEYLAVLSIRN